MEEKTIGEYVADDFRSAAIFSKYGIDFCCKGHKSIDEVCQAKGLDKEALIDEIGTVTNSNKGEIIDFKSWPLDLLIDYIEKKHHRYVEEKILVIAQFLNKLCKVHGERHPELFEIQKMFFESADELTQHMKKEELILFPFIKKMVASQNNESSLNHPPFGTVLNPIQMMKHEHNNEGERFRKIKELSNDYTPPQDACNTYIVTFAMIDEFEQDLHKHIHLENNILFPTAENLENKLLN
ncbi:iron-sulfur cluster repair di-iron protein [Flavobacterium sp. H122]|uniref:iron-sulfur cluster repair di-iron protein n=1 Tax=Flavobacterium sp. H122 TaxID=2529860 RepID=UPI0010AAFBA6|nr:iron-sulfur cluster repair di-iron protein [Flavobacterium sp. H122]